MSIRIGLFTIVVDDYDEAIEHYTKALGFDLDEDLDQGDDGSLTTGHSRRRS